MEEQKEITITRDIAEIFNKNGMESRHAESIIWDVLSSVYRLLKKKHGISKDEIVGLIDDHKGGSKRDTIRCGREVEKVAMIWNVNA